MRITQKISLATLLLGSLLHVGFAEAAGYSVVTKQATNISATGARLVGEVQGSGTGTFSVGFYMTEDGSTSFLAGNNTGRIGEFSSDIPNSLTSDPEVNFKYTCGKTYSYQTFILNQGQTQPTLGNSVSFKTPDCTVGSADFSVLTHPAESITKTGATLYGEVSRVSGPTTYTWGFLFSETGGTPNKVGGFNQTRSAQKFPVTNLTCGKNYTYKTYVTWGSADNQTKYGQPVAFNTISCDGSVSGGATGVQTAIEVTTLDAEKGSTGVTLYGKVASKETQSGGAYPKITTGFEVRESGTQGFSPTGKTNGQDELHNSQSFQYLYTGALTGVTCKNLEYRAIAQYTSILTGDQNKWVRGDIKTLSTNANCESPVSTSGGNGGNGSGNTNSCEYKLLVPSLPFANPNGAVNICTTASIKDLVQKGSNYLITIAIVLAVIFLIYGGFLYATGNAATALNKGKQIIINALTGLAFALFSWLLLNTLNKDIVKATLTIPTITQSVLNSSTGTNTTPGGTTGGTTGGSTGSTTPPTGNSDLQRILADEQRVRSLLSDGGISINASPCSSVGQTGCTNVGLLGQAAIDGVIALKKVCGSGCNVQITGGTEYWLHSSHGPNKSIVDLAFDSVLNNYIKVVAKASMQPLVCNGDRYPFTALYTIRNSSARYFTEDCPGKPAHWHVTY